MTKQLKSLVNVFWDKQINSFGVFHNRGILLGVIFLLLLFFLVEEDTLGAD